MHREMELGGRKEKGQKGRRGEREEGKRKQAAKRR
jgi:hypothetical protein